MTASLLALLTLSPAFAARLPVASVSSSSDFPEENGVRYDAKQASDGKVGSSWVEGEEGSGLGSWVEFDLGGEQTVTTVKIWGGLWYSHEYWTRANRPKDIELKFSDGSTEVVSLANEMKGFEFKLKKPVKTSTVRMKVASIHSGNTWLDTAISEVQFFDAAPEAFAPAGFKASSQLPADGDGSYDPANVTDGLADTMWCEGNKDGDGTGEWLELNLGSARSISKMNLINGMGASMGVYMKGNRAKTVTLAFSDGATEVVELKPVMFMPQEVSFPAHTTSSVRLNFTAVTKGKEYNDLCVSELRFQ